MAFGDYPTSNTPTIPYKLIGIVGAGIVMAVIIVGVVIRVLHRGSDSATRAQTEAITTMLAKCDGEDNVESCKRALVQDVSSSVGAQSVCAELTGDDRDGCYWKFAREGHNPDLCASITNEGNQTRCRDSALLATAKTNTDVSACDKIESSLTKQACKRLFQPLVTSDNCSSQGRSESYCEMIAVSERAQQAQDPVLCDALGDDERVASCHDRVDVDDPDFDHLQTDDEWLFQTDPRKADTDGDGFKDGDEVAAGYDPNGLGTLPVPESPTETSGETE